MYLPCSTFSKYAVIYFKLLRLLPCRLYFSFSHIYVYIFLISIIILPFVSLTQACISYLYPCRGYIDFSQKFTTQWRSRFRPHKVYIFLISMIRRVDLAMSVCSSVSTQSSLSVLKLSGWNFPKSFISFAGSV